MLFITVKYNMKWYCNDALIEISILNEALIIFYTILTALRQFQTNFYCSLCINPIQKVLQTTQYANVF